MKEVKRLKRIVAVRTTQRDLSAMKLRQAHMRAQAADQDLHDAHEQLDAAGRLVPAGCEVLSGDLERMNLFRQAALEEIAVCQVAKEDADQATAAALTQVQARQVLLRQSERLGEMAQRNLRARVNAAEQQLGDEQAGRAGRSGKTERS